MLRIFEKHYFEICRISTKEMSKLIDLYDQSVNGKRKFTEDEKGLFYCIDNGVYVACDNSSGHCWVEEFESKKDAFKWLLELNDY